MTKDLVGVQSAQVLARHGRTFRWASLLLPRAERRDASILYAFCREVDDLADEATDAGEAHRALDAVEAELRGAAPPRPVIAALLEIAARRGMDLAAATELVRTVRRDLGSIRIRDDGDLVAYCYGVAGTVGLLMTPLLGATDPRAAAHAIDLGIAMQLTNICRDVREDLLRDRVYLPMSRLRAAGVDPDAVLGADLAPVIGPLLALADRYYDSAREGLRFLPFRTRAAIHVALAVYRAIGIRLRDRHGANPSFGRTVVPSLARIRWSLVGLGEALAGLWAGGPADHDASLHRAIADLPGTHEGAA